MVEEGLEQKETTELEPDFGDNAEMAKELVENAESEDEIPEGILTEEQTEGVISEPAMEEEKKVAEEEPKYEVKVRGEVEKKTLQELKDGYSRMEDYTRSKQALAREQQELELARNAFMENYYQPNGTYYNPPQEQVATQRQPSTEEQPEFTTPTEERLYGEVQELRGAVGGILQRQELSNRQEVMDRVNGSINSFAEKHKVSEEKMVEVLKRYNELGGTRPSVKAFEDIYDGMFDKKAIEEAAVKAHIERQKKKPLAALEPSGESKTEVEPVDVRKLSDDEMMDAMEKELKFPSG